MRYSNFKNYFSDLSLPKEAIIHYPFGWEDVTGRELCSTDPRCWFGLPSARLLTAQLFPAATGSCQDFISFATASVAVLPQQI